MFNLLIYRHFICDITHTGKFNCDSFKLFQAKNRIKYIKYNHLNIETNSQENDDFVIESIAQEFLLHFTNKNNHINVSEITITARIIPLYLISEL